MNIWLLLSLITGGAVLLNIALMGLPGVVIYTIGRPFLYIFFSKERLDNLSGDYAWPTILLTGIICPVFSIIPGYFLSFRIIKHYPIFFYILFIYIIGGLSNVISLKIQLPKKEHKLLKYVELGKMNKVKELAAKGADLNIPGFNGNTPLTIAVCNGHFDIVKHLVSCGAFIDHQDDDGYTPLMKAVISDYSHIAKFLINRGADIDIKNKKGQTAKDLALKKSNQELSELLNKN